MAIIKVQSIPQKKLNARRLLAQLCYYYPRYSFEEARKLPYKDVILLINTAQQEKALNYFNLTQIAAAPNTKNGGGVSKLIKHYQKELNA